MEAHRLGRFQRGYRVKRGVLRFLHVSRWYGLFLGIIGLVAVSSRLWILLRFSPFEATDTTFLFGLLFLSTVGNLLSLWMGLFFIRSLITALEDMRIIIFLQESERGGFDTWNCQLVGDHAGQAHYSHQKSCYLYSSML